MEKQNGTRDNNALAREVILFDLNTHEGRTGLERHVRCNWSIREIDQFKCFLHGGNFISSADWTTGERSGLIAPTAKADAELQRLWDGLLALAWRLVGAASALHIEGAKPFKWVPTRRIAKNRKVGIITNDIEPLGDDDKLLDLTISELIQRIGNAYAAQSGTQSRLQKKLNAYEAKFGPLDD